MGLKWSLCVIVSTILIAMVTARPSKRHLHLEEKPEVKPSDSGDLLTENPLYEHTIHHFGRHILCNNNTGKRAFFNVMAKRIDALNEKFLESFVLDLCRLRSINESILDRWVQELFDTDSDGYITQAEMHYIV